MMNELFVQQMRLNFAASKGGNAFIDPAWIPIFADLAERFVYLINECMDTFDEGVDMVRSPTRLQRLVAKREIRKVLGRREFRENGRHVFNAMIKTGKDASIASIKELLDASSF